MSAGIGVQRQQALLGAGEIPVLKESMRFAALFAWSDLHPDEWVQGCRILVSID